jgi:MFS family permease
MIEEGTAQALARQGPRGPLYRFIAVRAADELASQMLNVAIGWYLYTTTRDPMSLAYVGLAQFVPSTALLLVAGHIADRFDRARIAGIALLVETVCVAGFALWMALASGGSVLPIYLLLVLLGAAHAFVSPTMAALLPRVVPAPVFPRAVAVSSSAFQICDIVGPAIGGLIYAVSAHGLWVVVAALYAVAMSQTFSLRGSGDAPPPPQPKTGEEGILAGLRYVWWHRLLLALISLDLFAVLLGGVSALLPIYASDILAVGPVGLGCLRCAPGVGAALVGLFLARRTIQRNAGTLMLACVAGFGLATVAFAISTNFVLSLAALAAAGGFDMVSMVIRQTLVQVATPDAMRGRVSAVNFAFIGASAQLGEFESGAAAALLGTVPAALLGGIGTLAVVGLWSVLFPELRRADRLAPAPRERG